MTHRDDQLTPEQEQENIRRLSRIVAQELARGGRPEAVIQALIGQGVPEHAAREFVTDIAQVVDQVQADGGGAVPPEIQAAVDLVRAQANQMARGLILLALGGVIALVAFLAIPNLPALAAVLLLVPVFFGGAEFVLGFIGWRRLRA